MKYRPHSNSALWTSEDVEVIRFRMRRLYNFQDAAIMFNAPIAGDEIDSRNIHENVYLGGICRCYQCQSM